MEKIAYFRKMMKNQQKNRIPEEGVRAVKTKRQEIADNGAKEKIDLKKLIIYSEIMRPKFGN